MRQRLTVCAVGVDDSHFIRHDLHEQNYRIVAVPNIPDGLYRQVRVVLHLADPTASPRCCQLTAVVTAEDRSLEAAQILLLKLDWRRNPCRKARRIRRECRRAARR